jgi:MFS family permease
MASSRSPSRPGLAIFRHRDFTRLLGARFFTSLAVQMQDVAVGWQVYELTGRSLDLGLIGLAEFLPAVGLALVTGAVVDRFDRRKIIMLCYATYALSALLLVALAFHPIAHVWPFMCIVVVFGTARAFGFPAQQALLPNLVPKEELGPAVALSSSTFQVATIGGPAIGGLLIGLGSQTVYIAAAIGFLISMGLISSIKLRAAARTIEPVGWANLLAGIRFINSRPEILGAVTLDLFAVLLGGATALMPIYARDILVIGPVGLGLLRSAPAVGATITAFTLAMRPLGAGAGRIMLTCVAIYGLGTIVFGLSTSFPLSLVALAVLGSADMCSVFVRQTLVQIGTPDAMRGRVSAVNSVFIGASNELGQFESGVTAAWFGTVPSVVIGGIGTLAVAGLWAWKFKTLRQVNLTATGMEELAAASKGPVPPPKL